jgi:predicted DNA-binding protein with PD1-like motif
MIHELLGVHEVAAVGTVFPAEDGPPRLHMHAAPGREGAARTGCVRRGIEVWKLGEVVLLEVLGVDLVRRVDPGTGFEVLDTPT